MTKKIMVLVAVLLIIAAGFVGYSFFRTPEEASAPIEAIPVVVEADTPVEPPQATIQTNDASEPIEAASQSEASEETNNAAAQTEVETAAEPSREDAVDETVLTIFEIVPAESEVRFLIDEVLRGEDFTVVGVTDQVAGQIAVDPGNLSATQMGPILVNARTLVTDNDFRNRAIKNQILSTDDFEFITFTPTEIVGLNGSGLIGAGYNFQIGGDLTIRDVTRPVTFETTATLVSETQLVGSASATVLYDDFGLTIPAARAVSAVDDDVRLEIDFVATATGEIEQASDVPAADPPANTTVDESAVAVVANEVSSPQTETLVNARLNLNKASGEDFQAAIPNFGNRMVREFLEYRPYISIQQFRQEIGKYVDETQVAEYEQYLFVPINVDEADAATLQQIPGVDETVAAELMAARPYGSNEAFLAKLADYVSDSELAVAQSYLVSQ